MSKHKKPFRPDQANYEVGYGKPPVATRFQPGQSGYPQGRPRKVETVLVPRLNDLQNWYAHEAQQMVTVTTGRRKRKIPAILAVYDQQLALALRGNTRAAKLVMEIHTKMVEGKEASRVALKEAMIERYRDNGYSEAEIMLEMEVGGTGISLFRKKDGSLI